MAWDRSHAFPLEANGQTVRPTMEVYVSLFFFLLKLSLENHLLSGYIYYSKMIIFMKVNGNVGIGTF